MKVVTRSRYLGGFIREQGSEAAWMEDNVEEWEASVRKLPGVDYKPPQTYYAGLQK